MYMRVCGAYVIPRGFGAIALCPGGSLDAAGTDHAPDLDGQWRGSSLLFSIKPLLFADRLSPIATLSRRPRVSLFSVVILLGRVYPPTSRQ